MKKFIALTSVISSAFFAHNILAADLNEIYQLSLTNDAELAAAKAKRDAGDYQVDLARAALLPQISLGATQANSDVKSDAGSADFDTFSYNATISQT
ncbi:MAG: outer membrane protein, partial [Marinoscillum sp.]